MNMTPNAELTRAYPHLVPYERPDHFADFGDIDRAEYVLIPKIGVHRDSDNLARSNFRTALKRLGGESETVLVIRDSHWAVGWVETIYIHGSDHTALAIAEDLAESIEDYPVLCESDWSELETETAENYWARMSVSERMAWCKESNVSIFAARRDYVPDDETGDLMRRLAE